MLPPAEAQPQTVMAPLPRAAGLLEIDCSETRRAKGSFETRGEADFWARILTAELEQSPSRNASLHRTMACERRGRLGASPSET